MKGQDVYKEVITMEFPNMIARVHIPDLTDDERKRRLQKIYEASANLLTKGR
jgi:hypothetical protein